MKGVKMKTLARKQRGVGFVGMIFVAVGIILAAVLGMKLVPSYIHNAQLAQIFKTIANDPDMRDASIMQVKSAFNKRAEVNNILDISGEDIEITKTNGKLSLSASYSVKIPLVANATLVLEFNPSSS
jgi:hypothetical protein